MAKCLRYGDVKWQLRLSLQSCSGSAGTGSTHHCDCLLVATGGKRRRSARRRGSRPTGSSCSCSRRPSRRLSTSRWLQTHCVCRTAPCTPYRTCSPGARTLQRSATCPPVSRAPRHSWASGFSDCMMAESEGLQLQRRPTMDICVCFLLLSDRLVLPSRVSNTIPIKWEPHMRRNLLLTL